MWLASDEIIGAPSRTEQQQGQRKKRAVCLVVKAGGGKWRYILGAMPSPGKRVSAIVLDETIAERIEEIPRTESIWSKIELAGVLRGSAQLSFRMIAAVMPVGSQAEAWVLAMAWRDRELLQPLWHRKDIGIRTIKVLMYTPQHRRKAAIQALQSRRTWKSDRAAAKAMRDLLKQVEDPAIGSAQEAACHAFVAELSASLQTDIRLQWGQERRLAIAWYDPETLLGILGKLAAAPHARAAHRTARRRWLWIDIEDADELHAIVGHLIPSDVSPG